MSRSYDPNAIIQLPRFDSARAATLLTELVTAAKGVKNLPKSVTAAQKRLNESLKAIQGALRDRLAVTGVDSARSRAADQAEDAAWSALFDFLGAFLKLPATLPQVAQARRAFEPLFSDGLKFTRLEFKKEWAEVQARIELMQKQGIDKLVHALGGEVFLKNIEVAHKEYGEALGVTAQKAAKAAATDAPLIGDVLASATDAIRSYVLRVSAWADDEETGNAAVAEQLLAPIVTMQSSASGPRGDKPAPAATGPRLVDSGSATDSEDSALQTAAAGGEPKKK